MKKHNFSAGPAILPTPVMEQAAKAVLDLDGIGLSVLEISHRSSEFSAILEEAVQLPKDLLGLSSDYEVLYLSGGASTQFFMSAMNLLEDDKSAVYLDTGSWSAKAIKEAKLFGEVIIGSSSKDANYTYIPKELNIPAEAQYVHLTSNNTIFGTQYHWWPDTDVPLVADMSSDIFSRKLPIERFGLIYAGAQKNLGPAGTTLVIVRKDLLGKVNRQLPSMVNYQTHIDKGSTFNTPPVFPIYVSMLTLRWIKEQGGLNSIEKTNAEKAEMIYREIDRNPLFRGTVREDDRSLMNATFLLENKDLEKTFLETCKKANISGIKGHRSVGGFRASIYNAMPKSSLEVLVQVMQKFAIQYA